MGPITSSFILCALGAIYGLYVLVKYLRVIESNVATEMKYAFPIICGTLAWASAAYTFYTLGINSHIDVPRVLMLISWCWLAGQYRTKYRTKCRRLNSLKKSSK